MISDETHVVPIDSIFVDRTKRQRKELTDIEALAASIAQVGLIHLPIIERSGELRTGERRWTACKSLGWTAIPIRYVDELDASELHLLELEENIRRVNLPWPEEVAAIEEWHRLRAEADPTWDFVKTGEALGMSPTAVGEKVAVAKELRRGNQMVKDADKYSTARGITVRAASRRAASTFADLNLKPAEGPARAAPLINEDFHEWAAAYTGPRFNLIHCDFPYGIEANEQQQGHQAKSLGAYADDFETFDKLLETLKMSMSNVVDDSAHLVFWFSMDYYTYTMMRLERMGWAVNPFPLIWHKSDNTGLLPDPQRGPRRIYETAFLASCGDRKIVRAKSNVFSWPGKDKEIHMSEKPVPMLSHFLEMLVDEYSNVLDPTCGSGNAIKAAHKLGAGRILGIERDPDFYNRATGAFFNDDADD